MTPTITHPTTAEAHRVREVYRYYQPHNSTDSLDSGDSSAQSSNAGTPQLLLDTGLTAFAQLIALRLDAQRAIISLTDHGHEYFVAESTSTLSRLNTKSYAQNQFLLMSGAKVARDASLCEQTLHLTSYQKTGEFIASIVPDLRLDEKLGRLACVTGSPYLRFYCGVALTNNKGVNIGSVYVVDDATRTEVSFEQVQFLTMMAATVMDYLENIRVREEASRVVRMSQGLHAFIEGDGTMRGDWERLTKYNLPAGAGIGYRWVSNKVDVVGTDNNKQPESPIRQSPLQYLNSSNEVRHLSFNSPLLDAYSEIDRASTLRYAFDGTANPDGQAVGGREHMSTADDYFSQKTQSGQYHPNDVFSLLHSTFSRASNLVREGMEVDGAVYFDAPVGLYQAGSALGVDLPRSNDSLSESGSSSADEDSVDVRQDPLSHTLHCAHKPTDNDHHLRRVDYATGEAASQKSDILGFSTQAYSSLNGENISDTDKFTAIDQDLLSSLVRRYPEGKIFTFDHHGPISVGKIAGSPEKTTVSAKHKRDRHKARKRAEMVRLLSVFPRARQIFFVPIYNSVSGCFIGSFTWSTSDTRIFSAENDLSYLMAFGHSVMTEVSRINILSVDRAKDQFINNVSHELRSPLHGILASAEFLAGTSMDGFQKSLVDTVDICGRTLLETIEQILDFSKLTDHEPKQSVVDTELDIPALIEDVLEDIYTGFELSSMSSRGLMVKNPTPDASDIKEDTPLLDDFQIARENDVLTIILDMDFREQWKFRTMTSTWRRLAVNLFSNSLKYTPVGWIKVKLEAQDISPVNLFQNNGKGRTMVTLTISDSGKGISSNFMKTKLFMPFSQEDVTTPGTGLGMSIVKQIVDLAGGTIDIRSDIGKGTQVKLSMPLDNSLIRSEDEIATLNSAAPEESEDPIDAVRRRAEGRTVTLRGFGGYSIEVDLHLEALASLKTSIERYVRDWFHLSIVSDESGSYAAADIVISDESAFLDLASVAGNELLSQGQSLLILYSKPRRDIYTFGMDSDRIIEFVSKPCGPRRLAKALLDCLDKEIIDNEADIPRVLVKGFGALGPKQQCTKKTSTGSKDSPSETTRPAVVRSAAMMPVGIADLQSIIEFSSPALSLSIAPRAYANTKSRKPAERPFLSNLPSGSASGTPASSGDKNASETTTPSSSSTTSASTKDPPEPNPDLSLAVESPPGLLRPKVLLVEDNPVNMMLLSTYMKKNNWDFETGENGLLALQIFENRLQGFDVIFMDVSMPIMTGYESTRAIRKLEAARRSLGGTNRAALIIALTGFSSTTDQKVAFESGVDIFMTKPVRFKEVGRILDGWARNVAAGVAAG